MKVTIKGLGKNGKIKTVTAEGFLARALQHEIDHLDGILFIDKMVPVAEVEGTKDDGREDEGMSTRECKVI